MQVFLGLAQVTLKEGLEIGRLLGPSKNRRRYSTSFLPLQAQKPLIWDPPAA